tara:strand:+ start:5076 stop:5621 length:546 start_codon:yes stop_codon:yes gene_type:complete
MYLFAFIFHSLIFISQKSWAVNEDKKASGCSVIFIEDWKRSTDEFTHLHENQFVNKMIEAIEPSFFHQNQVTAFVSKIDQLLNNQVQQISLDLVEQRLLEDLFLNYCFFRMEHSDESMFELNNYGVFFHKEEVEQLMELAGLREDLKQLIEYWSPKQVERLSKKGVKGLLNHRVVILTEGR